MHGSFEGPINYSKLSPDSMMLSSSAVVQAHPVRTTVRTKLSARPSVVTHEFVVDRAVSDISGAVGDRPVAVGDHLFVDEKMAYEDVPFSDDPPIRKNEEAVLFLRPVVGRNARIEGRHLAYQYTAPLVSKVSITTDGHLYMRGGPGTAMRSAMHGKTLNDLIGRTGAVRLGAQSVRVAATAAVDPRARILQLRGLSPMQNGSLFRTHPEQILRQQARYDGALNPGW
jgi:hypothetical protein